MVNKDSGITYFITLIYICLAKFIKVYVLLDTLTLVKLFIMLKSVGQKSKINNCNDIC